jgi:predicted pyridoxine 5'-phosphate oxidase superfamily flavin-nucleotide-binding protein
MQTFYTNQQRALQEQFETAKMADLLHQVIVHSEVQEPERAFIESRDMFFLATVDGRGQPTCSYKGGDPGFVKVVDATTLAFPTYDGNGMFLSQGNIRTSARVGMLFIDFETPHRLRVQGTASAEERELYQRVAPSRYVPRPHCERLFAEWKRINLVQAALPPRDGGKTVKAGGTITVDNG